jgi:hypothetical protein
VTIVAREAQQIGLLTHAEVKAAPPERSLSKFGV